MEQMFTSLCDALFLELEKDELERLTRIFTSKISLILGSQRDIPAPDMGTDAQVMAWMMDEYGKRHGHTPEIVTGKPIELGGSIGRNEATGHGTSVIIAEAIADFNLSFDKVVIQGFGNVGSHTALYLEQMGAKIIAISDYGIAGINIRNTKHYGFQFHPESSKIQGMKLIKNFLKL